VKVDFKFTKIKHEILEALCRTRIPGEARQVLDCIIRKTYGFSKKEDWIALSQFVVATGLSKPRISHSLKKLFAMNIIAKKGNGKIGLQTNPNLWKPLPKKAKPEIIAKKGKKLCQIRQEPLPLLGTTIDNTTIDTTTKDNNYSKGEGKGKDKNLTFEPKTPLQKIIACYMFKKRPELQDVEPGQTEKIREIKKWNKLNYKKWVKYANELLEYFDGDYRKVIECIDELGEQFDKLGNWTLAAVARGASDWEYKEKKENQEGGSY